MRINVIMGGPSAEYDVSIVSGIEVVRHLLVLGKYDVRAVVVTQDLHFHYLDITNDTVPDRAVMADPAASGLFKGPIHPASASAVWDGCSVAFLVVHGSFGEDGRFQGYLETIGVPYTGSGVFASAVAMNKIASKHLFVQHGIDTPPFTLYGKDHGILGLDALIAHHGLPCFVKCPQSGSSKLMGRAVTRVELEALLAELSHESPELLIESEIQGPEFTCPVLEYPDGTVNALPPVEIRPKGTTYFDFHAKYTENASEEIVPAPRPAELISRIQECARRVHTLLGCKGVSRTDMILQGSTLHVLETNTLPGLTATSLLPKAFAAAGGTYEGLLDVMIQTAIATRRKAG